jgi:pimeloyl-[acyl-carrier protein] methyl ester esterase
MLPIPLVLLPGLDGTGEQFAPLVPELGETIAPIIVRYPPDRALDYDALLPLALARAPGDQPYVLVGESFSGPLAIQIAATRPPGLRALVLVASFHRRPVAPWLAWTGPRVPDLFFARPPPAFVVRQLLAGADAPAALVASFRASARSVRRDVLAARVRAALEVDVSSELARVNVPITYLAATRDALVRPAVASEMKAIVPTLDVRPFACAHLVLQRRPREAAAVLREIAERALAPRVG